MKDINKLTDQENTFLLKKLIVDSIYSASRLENVNTTFPQTETIINGMSVAGISTEDTQVILNLKNAWQWVLNNHTSSFDLEISNKINNFIAYNESIDWGKLRTGNIVINGVDFQPPVPNGNQVENYIKELFAEKSSITEKALKWMYYSMRSQLYWDGNKRTAILSANYIMLQNGVGGVLIQEKLLDKWNKLLSKFYETGDDKEILDWTYKNCIVRLKK